MLARNNLDTEILAELEAAELDDIKAQDNIASAFMHRVRAGWRLREKADILKQEKAFHHYLRGLAHRLAEKGYPPNGQPYSIRWFQIIMFLGEHLPTEADAKPVSHLGVKENMRRIRAKLKPKLQPATGDVSHDRVQVLLGDCRERMKELPDESVDVIITSPPYYRLRDFDRDAPLPVWDGDPDCPHDWERHRDLLHGPVQSSWSDKRYAAGGLFCDWGRCGKCGAMMNQLGHEHDVDTCIRHLVEIFRLARRVLKKTGFMLLNIGDGYERGTGRELWIPQRLTLALDADGWHGRNEIIWAKCREKFEGDDDDRRTTGLGTPENITDRFARADERVLFFANAPQYAINKAALREPATSVSHTEHPGQKRLVRIREDGTRQKSTVWFIAKEPTRHGDHFALMPEELARRLVELCPAGGTILDPFGGLATTGKLAQETGRNAIIIEVSPKYVAMALDRLKEQPTNRPKLITAKTKRRAA